MCRISAKLFHLLLAVISLIIIANVQIASLYAYAGGKISGKIIDAASKEPLPGVTVRVEKLNLGAVTDLAGEYVILNIPPGSYNIQASMVGYKSIKKTDVDVSINHTTRIDFDLDATVVQVGQEVVVVAERPLVEKDKTSSKHYIEASEIATRPTSQLTEILTTLPGIDANNGELLVRRGSLDQVSFLIDGIRARNPLDFQPYTNINLTSIQELEIITGGFSAEYGDAQSGVFNIVTKEGSSKFEGMNEFRWTPAGVHHWGTALYDYGSGRYWENTHARHLQWWIDNPDQWVDPNGKKGSDPNSMWTPYQAYQDYMNTHKPLSDYTNKNTYQTELSLGGPMPIKDMYFFASGKYRSAPPISGISYRDIGTWFDGTAKITYNFTPTTKIQASGFYSIDNSDYGMNEMVLGNGLEYKYAYYDNAGYPENRMDGQTLKFTHVLSNDTYYEFQLSRVYRYRSQSTFPGDSAGWETGTAQYDRLRAVDENGSPIIGGYNNTIGLHTTGYFYRGEDKNTDMTLSGDMVSQISKKWQIKTGFDFTYYTIDRFQQAKAYNAVEKHVYHPYESNIYVQNTLEFEGLIMNLGLRLDLYNVNDKIYENPFDPFGVIAASKSNTTPDPMVKNTPTIGQLSPRIGISHPISDKTVLHFSYGHFFQRANFGNYGEGTGISGDEVNGLLNSYLNTPEFGYATPYNLGNRELKPKKTVQYELGIEHNIGGLVTDITAYYKDYTNTVRMVKVYMYDGTFYKTSGNSDYSDSKGVEIQIRKPLSGLWGGYLSYTWSTGISGRSGDPDIIAAPGSGVQTASSFASGDRIDYDRPRLKFGITLLTPSDAEFLSGLFSNIYVTFNYQVYYPHEMISEDNYGFGGKSYIRQADKNSQLLIKKEFDLFGFRPAFFIEVNNLFNDTNVNLQSVNSVSDEDKARFVNSRFTVFPEKLTNGGTFPDMLQFRNLPRTITFGLAVGI